MDWKKLIILGSTLTLLSGCNIVIRVGEGGAVLYDNGNKSCGPNEECVVSVTDFLFSDVFTAEAASGYEFVSWRRRDRGLCGGSTAPCQLSTRDLPRNPAIRRFLNSDDEDFFLVAVFRRTETGGGASGSGNASDCFNEELFSQGTQGKLRYRFSAPGQPSLDIEEEFMVNGPARFNGQRAIEVVATAQEFVDGILADVEARSYVVVESGVPQVKTLGSEVDANADGVMVNVVNTNDPYSLQRYNLSAGQSYEDRFTLLSETSSPQFPPGFSTQTRLNIVNTITFLGIESVTVPAGTYRACKWEVTSRSQGSVSTTTNWEAVGRGVPVKTEDSEGTTLELLPRSTLNGSSI